MPPPQAPRQKIDAGRSSTSTFGPRDDTGQGHEAVRGRVGPRATKEPWAPRLDVRHEQAQRGERAAGVHLGVIPRESPDQQIRTRPEVPRVHDPTILACGLLCDHRTVSGLVVKLATDDLNHPRGNRDHPGGAAPKDTPVNAESQRPLFSDLDPDPVTGPALSLDLEPAVGEDRAIDHAAVPLRAGAVVDARRDPHRGPAVGEERAPLVVES